MKGIRESGERSLKLVSLSVHLFFAIACLLPVLWMLSSSFKDMRSIDAYPPKWIPRVPLSIEVTLDYTGVSETDPVFYQKDAMRATWFPWMANMKENIGEVRIVGTREGKMLYRAKTTSASFQIGQPLIVPSTLFNEGMMDRKLPIIESRKLSEYKWIGAVEEQGNVAGTAVGKSDNEVAGLFREFYSSMDMVKGKVQSIEEFRNFWRLFDSYLTLNKVAQETDQTLGFFRFFANSTIVTVASISVQLILGGLAGYALSSLISGKKLKTFVLMYFLATIMIPDVSILMPLYLTMQKLHLVDTLWAIILPHAAWGIVIFLFKGFFDQLPLELLQAARVDGASELRTFAQLVVPMSIPIFTIVAIMTFVPVWNEFMWPLVAAKSPENWTFTVALNNLQNQSLVRQNTIMASSVVSMLPLLLIFLTSLKYIEKGISFTGVKG